MGTKFLTIGLLIMATLFIWGSGCGKDNGFKPCRNGRYSFAVTSEFSPQSEVYNIGDTIFLNSTFPKILYDNVSLQNVNFSNSLGIGGNLAIGFLDSNAQTILYALPKFKIVNIFGSTTPVADAPEGGLNILYQEDVNYNFKLAIVCLAKGIYRFGLTDLGSQGISGKACTNAGFSMQVTNTNKNINLFQLAIGYTPDAQAIKTIYCFRVQ